MSQYFQNDDSIQSKIRMVHYNFKKYNFDFYSDNGVFSKNEIDYGSSLLINTIVENVSENKKILDVGGGVGVISIVLAKVLNYDCTMLEINKRAIELAKENIKLNRVENVVRVIESDVYEKVEGKYDLVITNPPIRAGKKVVYEFLFKAFDHLNDNGELWFVMRKNHGANSAMKDLVNAGYKCYVMEKDRGFFIIKVAK